MDSGRHARLGLTDSPTMQHDAGGSAWQAQLRRYAPWQAAQQVGGAKSAAAGLTAWWRRWSRRCWCSCHTCRSCARPGAPARGRSCRRRSLGVRGECKAARVRRQERKLDKPTSGCSLFKWMQPVMFQQHSTRAGPAQPSQQQAKPLLTRVGLQQVLNRLAHLR